MITKVFLKSVREASLSGIWSQGVKLARSGAVSLEEEGEDEVIYRVRTRERPVAFTIVLYPKENEWSCDCDSRNDPCSHVIASAIVANEAAAGSPVLKKAGEAIPKLAYRLHRGKHQNISIERVFEYPDGREEQLSEPLTRSMAAHRCPANPSQEDLDLDRLLHSAGVGPNRASIAQGLTAEQYRRVLPILALNGNTKLDGKKIKVSAETLAPDARLVSKGTGVELIVEKPEEIDEIVDRGIARVGKKLFSLVGTEFAGGRFEGLPLRKEVKKEEIGQFVSNVLPELEKQLTITIQTRKLPKRGAVGVPRISFDMTPSGHTLSVLPTLVYGEPPTARIDGDTLVHLSGEIPKRDLRAERRILSALLQALNLQTGRTVHFDGAEASKFAKRLQEFQKNKKAKIARDIVLDKPLVADLKLDADTMDLRFYADGDEEREAPIQSVFRAWRDGLDMVPLEDGGWAPLPVDWLERYGHRVIDILNARREDGSVPKYASAPMAALCEELGVPAPPTFTALSPLLEDFDGLPPAELPDDVDVELRPYQERGIAWLKFLASAGLGAILADDMGLGKTLQTLCALKGRTLVVCPKSVVFNWASEVEKFRSSLSVDIYHGPKRQLGSANITLTTYSVLRLDIEKLRKVDWQTVVLDEAQAIKNADSQAARAAFSLSESIDENAFRVALSGTPVENRLDELWSVFRFTHPGYLGERRSFLERYGAPIARGDDEAAVRLRKLTLPFLMRRLKKDVAKDLPPRTDVVMHVELEEDERELYDAIHAAKQKEVIETLEGGGNVMAALEALLRLRQAACHPSLIPGQSRETSSKVEALMDAVEDVAAGSHQCIVFSQWTSLLNLVQKQLEDREIRFVRLDGSTRDRAAVVNEFQSEGGPTVFLSSLKAGGTGLNLTAADHVFLLDPWWNPAAEDQAADRAHRIGQTRPVTVYRLIAKDTIEEGILKLQDKKRAIANAALAEGGAATGITRDDLIGLLRG